MKRKHIRLIALGAALVIVVYIICRQLYWCSLPYSPATVAALKKAGSNRSELTKLLAHYSQSPSDSLKYRAAEFLIENMPYYSYYEGDALTKYQKYFEVYADGRHDAAKLVDSLTKADGAFSIEQLRKREDVKTLSAEFLITHIDWAFKVKDEQPWGKNVSFRDFCEYVLPYRIGDEQPSLWREEVYNKFNLLLDSLRTTAEADDPIAAAITLYATLQKKPTQFTMQFPAGPHLGPKVIDYYAGSCRDLNDIMVYACRALGIPCGIDWMKPRGNDYASHNWSFLLDKNGKNYFVEFGVPKIKLSDAFHHTFAKIGRTTFSLNRNMMSQMHDLVDVPPIFRLPFFEDVTRFYSDTIHAALTVPLNQLFKHPEKDEPLYLCLSRHQDWAPVAFAYPGKTDVSFANVHGGVVCVVGAWNVDRHAITPVSYPFFIPKQSVDITFFKPQASNGQITLFTKFPLFDEFFIGRMVGGVVEGSHSADFRNADTLYRVTQTPYRLLTNVVLTNTKAYRYVRYMGGSDSHCNISELMLFRNAADTVPLHGRVLGTPGCAQGDGSHEYTNVFDGDPYTSFDYKEGDGGWAGLDLGKPERIARLAYIPRNRDNFIRRGDQYELFYWEANSWKSCGTQTARADSLFYSVPAGALLYLKNHTRGMNERIFEYKNGKQIFW